MALDTFMLSFYAECRKKHSAECRYAEYRGAILRALIGNFLLPNVNHFDL